MSAKFSLLILFGVLAAVAFASRKPAGRLRLDHDFSNTLKGVAMAMILYHHTGIYHSKDFWYLYLSGWGFCGVSLFFFISGYGLSASFNAKGYTYAGYFRKRFLSIWPCIVLCMVARWGLNPLMTIDFSPTLNPLYLLGLFEWYILAIAFWYTAFIIIRKQSASNADMLFSFFVSALCLWSLLDILSTVSIQAEHWLRFPFSFALGAMVATVFDKVIDYLNDRLAVASIALALAFGLAIHLRNQINLVYPMLDLISPALGICMVLWMYRIGYNSSLLLWMGKSSLPLYLLQVPLIKYGIFLVQWRRDALGIIATWAVVFAASAVVHWLDRRVGTILQPLRAS